MQNGNAKAGERIVFLKGEKVVLRPRKKESDLAKRRKYEKYLVKVKKRK